MEALLVIDVDTHDCWLDDIDQLFSEKQRVAFAIKNVVEEWRRLNRLIIFIVLDSARYNNGEAVQLLSDGGEQTKCMICDSSISHLAKFLQHRHGAQYEPAFIKAVENAFMNPELSRFLQAKKVTKVFLAGCNTFQCVLNTARGALQYGFDVGLLESCVYPAFRSRGEKRQWINSANTSNDKQCKVRIVRKK